MTIVPPVNEVRERSAAVPPLLMIVSGVSLYTGAALAVGLFDVFPPTVVAWMRMAGAAVILLVLFRPKLSVFTGRVGLIAAFYGLATAAMNMTFYEAIARIPLGTAVAVEFLGPIVVAAVVSRTWRQIAAVVLAGAGVVLIADVQLTANPVRLAFVLAAAALWAGYILMGAKVAGAASPKDSMTVGFAYAALLTSPVLLLTDGSPAAGASDWGWLLLTVLGLGFLSAVVPYGLDQVILQKAGADYFAILLALLPLTAALIGFVGLGQVMEGKELFGMAAIVIAVVLRTPMRRGGSARHA